MVQRFRQSFLYVTADPYIMDATDRAERVQQGFRWDEIHSGDRVSRLGR